MKKKIDWIVSLRVIAAVAIVLWHVEGTWLGTGGGYRCRRPARAQ